MGGKVANPMRRHFVVTLWYGLDGERFEIEDSRDFTPEVDAITQIALASGGRFVAWVVEDSRLEPESIRKTEEEADGGGVHIHAYLELERSVRWSTMVVRFQEDFHGANVQVRKGLRKDARDYASGFRWGVEKASRVCAGTWGVWRDDDGEDTRKEDISSEAALMVMQGRTPRDIAERFPRWFISQGAGVTRLWETINRRRWQNE